MRAVILSYSLFGCLSLRSYKLNCSYYFLLSYNIIICYHLYLSVINLIYYKSFTKTLVVTRSCLVDCPTQMALRVTTASPLDSPESDRLFTKALSSNIVSRALMRHQQPLFSPTSHCQQAHVEVCVVSKLNSTQKLSQRGKVYLSLYNNNVGHIFDQCGIPKHPLRPNSENPKYG